MMKKVWLVLLVVALVFSLAMFGCSSSSDDDDPTGGDGTTGDGTGDEGGDAGADFTDLWNEQWVAGASKDGPATLVLGDNFEYGAGYQVTLGWDKLLNKDIKVNDVYQLEIAFTVSRDLEDDLQWVIVDTDPNAKPNAYWSPLSRYKTIVNGKDEEAPTAEPSPDDPDGPVTPKGDGFKTTDTVSYVGRVLITQAGPKTSSELAFTTKGEGTKGDQGSGKKGSVTLNFTKFTITKLEWGTAEGGGGGGEETDEGNLGLPSYNKGTGDADGAESQAKWVIDGGDLYDTMVTAGTKLVVTFKNEIAAGGDIIWQDTVSYGWNDTKSILGDAGEAVADKGTTVSADKKTITIDLSKALVDYNVANTGFIDQTAKGKKVQLFLAYYTGDNKMAGLKVVKADLVAAPSTGTFVPVTGIGFAGKTTIKEDETLDLAANVVPSNATNKTIAWSATGGTIANGVFTPTTAGTGTITMTVANGLTASTPFTRTINIKIDAKPVEGIEFELTEIRAISSIGGPIDDNQKWWAVNVDDLDKSNYIVVKTDTAQSGANAGGFGGMKIGWQGNGSPGYDMSTGTSAKGWTPMTRSGVIYLFISLDDIEDYTASTTGTSVRFFIGNWPWAELGATGDIQLVTITTVPAGVTNIETGGGDFIGFAITQAGLTAALNP